MRTWTPPIVLEGVCGSGTRGQECLNEAGPVGRQWSGWGNDAYI